MHCTWRVCVCAHAGTCRRPKANSSVRVHSTLDGFSESQNSPTALNVPQHSKNSGWQRANKQPVLQRCEEWTAMTGPTHEEAKTRRDRSSAGARTHSSPVMQWAANLLEPVGVCFIKGTVRFRALSPPPRRLCFYPRWFVCLSVF